MFEVIQMSVQHVRQPLLSSRRHRFPRVDRTSASSAWRITMSFLRSKRRNEMSSFRTWLALMVSPFIKVSKKSLATSINIRTSLSLYDGSQYVVFVGSSGTTTFHTVLATFVMNLIRKTAAVLRREGKYFVFVDLALGLQREKWWWNSKPKTFQHINLFGVEKHDSWILPSSEQTYPTWGQEGKSSSKVPWYRRGVC